MWKDISAAWKAAFEAGWESFKSSSIPIGAAICDENGGIIGVGRNKGQGNQTRQRPYRARGNGLPFSARYLDVSEREKLHPVRVHGTLPHVHGNVRHEQFPSSARSRSGFTLRRSSLPRKRPVHKIQRN